MLKIRKEAERGCGYAHEASGSLSAADTLLRQTKKRIPLFSGTRFSRNDKQKTAAGLAPAAAFCSIHFLCASGRGFPTAFCRFFWPLDSLSKFGQTPTRTHYKLLTLPEGRKIVGIKSVTKVLKCAWTP
jgi:hypothetical protein